MPRTLPLMTLQRWALEQRTNVAASAKFKIEGIAASLRSTGSLCSLGRFESATIGGEGEADMTDLLVSLTFLKARVANKLTAANRPALGYGSRERA
jgi:hypothetical protein